MNEQASALCHLNLKFNVYEWEQALCVCVCFVCVLLLEIRLRAIYSVKCVAHGNSTRKHLERGGTGGVG